MNTWIICGLLLNVVYAVVMSVFEVMPTWMLVALGVGLVVQVVGVMLVTAGRFRWGAYAMAGGGVPLLPVSGVVLYGLKILFDDLKDGVLSDEHADAVLAPRSWRLAAIGFGLTAVAGLIVAVVWMGQNLAEVSKLAQVLSAMLLSVAAALEAVMLWRRLDQAYRLGLMLCLAGLGAALLAGFYLHNYVAVALLVWPIYLGWMLIQGRERWKGFNDGELQNRRPQRSV